MKYICLLRKEPDSIFGVDFPDFPGCFTATEEFKNINTKAKDALELHIEGMLEDREVIPKPSSIEEIMSKRENWGDRSDPC